MKSTTGDFDTSEILDHINKLSTGPFGELLQLEAERFLDQWEIDHPPSNSIDTEVGSISGGSTESAVAARLLGRWHCTNDKNDDDEPDLGSLSQESTESQLAQRIMNTWRPTQADLEEGSQETSLHIHSLANESGVRSSGSLWTCC